MGTADRGSCRADPKTLDVLIIGAGISGINAAYFLQTQGPAKTRYTILENRPSLGGTWDLFRYPGIRSDSDIFTFGFSWNPWKGKRTLAIGPEILSYLEDSATAAGITQNIKFNHRVESLSWSSKESLWTAKVVANKSEEKKFTAQFVILGTGFFDFDQPLPYVIPGIETFDGSVVQPQFWPEDLKYAGKNVVIVGSGATAITLLPTLAIDAAHVTMLQRSPTYIAAISNRRSWWARLAARILPSWAATAISRYQYITTGAFFYNYCISNPAQAKQLLLARTAQQLPPTVQVDPHFTPRYSPWEQRLCVCPDGDFYRSLRSGKASVVTDTIETISGREIQLKSGAKLTADIIVAATGLKIRFAGGIPIFVDGELVDPAQKLAWKGTMIQDVPNLAFIIGYVNASWTLGADASSVMFARLMKLMVTKSASSATPRLKSGTATQQREPIFSLTSTYIRDSVSKLFPSGGQGQWQLKKNYWKDIREAHQGDIQTDMEFC